MQRQNLRKHIEHIWRTHPKISCLLRTWEVTASKWTFDVYANWKGSSRTLVEEARWLRTARFVSLRPNEVRTMGRKYFARIFELLGFGMWINVTSIQQSAVECVHREVLRRLAKAVVCEAAPYFQGKWTHQQMKFIEKMIDFQFNLKISSSCHSSSPVGRFSTYHVIVRFEFAHIYVLVVFKDDFIAFDDSVCNSSTITSSCIKLKAFHIVSNKYILFVSKFVVK